MKTKTKFNTEYTTEYKTWIEDNLMADCHLYALEVLKGVEKLNTDGADIFTVDNFLTKEESEHLISVIKSSSRPSETTNDEGEYANYRTSETCDLSLMKDEIIKNVDNRISSLLGINGMHGEGMQGQWYKIGQEFKRHTDFFGPDVLEEYQGNEVGNRTWTFMICLNDVEEGGHTHFHEYDLSIPPVQGKAIFWNNLTGDEIGNHNTMHSGLPVEKGEKFIITKWFRQGQY